MPRPREQNSISLFPFLAVLVCAMGALILLLLVTTRRIRMEAVERAYEAAQAEEEPVPPAALGTPPTANDELPPLVQHHVPAAPAGAVAQTPAAVDAVVEPPVEAPRPPLRPFDPNPGLRQRIAALARERDRRGKQLEALSAELRAVRERTRSIDGRLAESSGKLRETRAARDGARRTAEELQEQHRRLAAQIHELDRRIARAQQQQAVEASKFAVLPYDGVSGTNRRPIFIEFTDEGIRFVPEGVLLHKQDFEGFTPGYNPLLAGAQALVNYWTEKSRRSGEPLPYVLLIVRPSGVRYYPLRLLLDRLGQPFGYELLEEGQELALPEADPSAAEVCRAAVERLLSQRDALLEIVGAPGEYGGSGGGGTGGPAMHPAGSSLNEWLTGPDGPDGSGAPGGPGDAAGGSRGSPSDPAGSAAAAGVRQGPVFRGYQRPSYDLVEPDSGIVLPGYPRRPRVVHLPSGPRGGGPGAIVSGATPERDPNGASGGRGAAGLADPASGSTAEMSAGLVPETIATPAGVANGASREHSTGARPPSEGNTVATPTSNSGWTPFRTAERMASMAEGIGDRPADGGHGTVQGRPYDGDRHGSSAGLSRLELSDPFESMLRGGGDAADFSEGSGAGAASSASGGARGSGAGSGDPAAAPAGTQELMSPSVALPTYSLRNAGPADSRPHHRRWGLSHPRATIGFEREVSIDVSADRLVIGGEQVVQAGDAATREELVRRTLHALEATARSWGPPPDAFYWIPSLRFRVAPGGNVHYERLRGPLREWGLQSSATYTLDAPRTAERTQP